MNKDHKHVCNCLGNDISLGHGSRCSFAFQELGNHPLIRAIEFALCQLNTHLVDSSDDKLKHISNRSMWNSKLGSQPCQ